MNRRQPTNSKRAMNAFLSVCIHIFSSLAPTCSCYTKSVFAHSSIKVTFCSRSDQKEPATTTGTRRYRHHRKLRAHCKNQQLPDDTTDIYPSFRRLSLSLYPPNQPSTLINDSNTLDGFGGHIPHLSPLLVAKQVFLSSAPPQRTVNFESFLFNAFP